MVLHTTRHWMARLSVLLLLGAPGSAVISHAQVAPQTAKPTGVAMKIQPMLQQLVQQSKTARNLADLSCEVAQVDASGQVQVYINLKDDSVGAVDRLKNMGFKLQELNTDLHIAQGWLPLGQIETMAAMDSVKEITLPDYARPRQGSVLSEGYALLNVGKARSGGATGKGVTIGCISDGVAHRGAAQRTGDLPEILVDPGHEGFGDEGTALLEIVHDVAPAANLVFSGPRTSIEFVNSLRYLTTWGKCQIIFDDLGFYAEPYFEDGPVAKAVNDIADDVTYLAAAGNDSEFHYQGDYVDVDPSSSAWPRNLHTFGGTDVSQQVVVPAATRLCVFLQWNDPWGKSTNDYDLHVYDISMEHELAISNARQNGDDNPYEALVCINKKEMPVTMNIMVNRYSGSAKKLELFVWNASALQFTSAPDSIFGHPTLPSVLSVGTVNAKAPSTIASYSSVGPSTMIGASGLTTRQTPSVVAVDGVSITGAGNYPLTFYGTSAAAAHAAGIAALTMNGHPGFTPAQIISTMKSTAKDLGPAGYDNIYGAGLLNAGAAAGLPQTAVHPFWQMLK